MRVIEKHTPSDSFSMRVKCEQVVDVYGFSYGKAVDFCGSILEITAYDIGKHRWYKYPGFSDVDYGVICPVCGKFVVVDTEKIPSEILKNVKEIKINSQ